MYGYTALAEEWQSPCVLGEKSRREIEVGSVAGSGRGILGAVGGCVAAGVPLLAGDIVANLAQLSVSESALVGVAGLLGGIVLGGIVAGSFGGRRGGIGGATSTGFFAAVLYAIVVVGSMLGWSAVETAWAPLLKQPLSMATGLIFLGALLTFVALLTGVVVRPRRSDGQHAAPRAATNTTTPARPAVPPARGNASGASAGHAPPGSRPLDRAASRPAASPNSRAMRGR